MPLRLYNTFSKREEDVVPADTKNVTMYTCGPTVYGRPHIGNYSSFLMADLLRRWMEAGHGWNVHQVKNITDVGHLLHDSDTGDDKIQKQAEREKLHPLEIARRYTEQYLEDERALNMCEIPEADRPRASAYIPQMLAIIRALLEKGNAYETNDGIYFSVESFPAYGSLSGNTLKNLSAGARIEVDERKKHPADFALWKKCIGDNGRHVLRWSFATGEVSHTEGEDPASGFPGWHIECSAMSRALLGSTIDLHTGGEDNIFPHHECEIAQSECSGSTPFVRLWLHKRRIDLAGEKMSKSLGNVLTIPDILERGYSPLDLRYYFLSVHYRTNLKFAWKGMDDAKSARRTITDWIVRDGRGESSTGKKPLIAEVIEKYSSAFDASMDSDLNTPGALAAVFDCLHAANAAGEIDQETAKALQKFAQKVRHTFGCFEPEGESVIPKDVQKLLDERTSARNKKDFVASDRLRDAIVALGYELKDTAQGQQVRRR